MTDMLDPMLDPNAKRGDRPHRASSRSVEFRPIEVVVQEGNVNRALSMLKRKMAAEGVLRELKRRRHYMKPSVKRRKKASEAARRRRKRTRTETMP